MIEKEKKEKKRMAMQSINIYGTGGFIQRRFNGLLVCFCFITNHQINISAVSLEINRSIFDEYKLVFSFFLLLLLLKHGQNEMI